MAQGGFKDLLKNGGFQAFLWTQFFGALNDNLYKIIVSMRAVHVAATTGSGSEYLSLAGAVFVIPFLLFSGYSGHLADAVSKRKVLIAVKVFEIVVMLLGLAAFFSTRIELMLLVLFLMALHSTDFQPGQVRHRAGNAGRPRSVARQRAARNEHVRRDRARHVDRLVAVHGLEERPWNMGVAMVAVAVTRVRSPV